MNSLDNAFALLIGVGDDLPVTVLDATAIANVLEDPNLAGYKPENIFLLTNEKASRQGILNAFEELIARTDEDSSVFLFYSGHGGTYSDNTFLEEENWVPEAENKKYFHLVPNGFNPVEYENTWVKAEELKERLTKLNSRRLIFFLDCCHAAGMTESLTGLGNAKPQNKLEQAEGLAQRIDDGNGMSIISSCRADQKSYIMDGDTNSLFTKCLLEVLRGKHKNTFEEPFIRITEVTQYIFRKVPQENPNQRPYVNLQMYDDFILSCLPEALRTNLINSDSSQEVMEETAQAPAKSEAKKEVVTQFRQEAGNNNALLFVHGFSGQAAATFGKIPDYLQAYEGLAGWDMFPVGYTEYVSPDMGKNIWASVNDIQRIADFLETSIQHKFGDYSRIAIVAHGLGGLVAQEALLGLSAKHLERISHVLLFGTPSTGVSQDALGKMANNRLSDLGSESEFIKQLRKQWDNRFKDQAPFSFKAITGTQDTVAPPLLSTACFNPDDCLTIGGDHFGMIQPESEQSDAFELIKNTLCGNAFHQQYSNKEEINLALGEYEAVINKLLPKASSLDVRGLVRLVFALEGSDRQNEALELLNKHPQAQTNSNLMGILGGRHKRRYLETYEAKEAERAMEYYQKGLEIAVGKDDNEQIYYLAINLAFLNLVYLDDKSAMRKFANQALEACKEDPFPSLWKTATQAEAALYMGDFDSSKQKYAAAADKAGIREKLSIYNNAYWAYTTLMDTDNPKDDFIAHLHKNFLS